MKVFSTQPFCNHHQCEAHRRTLEWVECVTLAVQCTVLYSGVMSRRKPSGIVRYTIRLKQGQAERVAAMKAQLHLKSDNEVFDYLVTVAANERDDLMQLVFSLFGNLDDSVARRLRGLETVAQLHLALMDSFMKYVLTSLPAVPESQLEAARSRAFMIYEQVNLTAAREFHKRRNTDTYSADELGFAELATESDIAPDA